MENTPALILNSGHDARVMGWCREISRPVGLSYGRIASIACANHFTIASRTIRDLEECGVEVVNPVDVSPIIPEI